MILLLLSQCLFCLSFLSVLSSRLADCHKAGSIESVPSPEDTDEDGESDVKFGDENSGSLLESGALSSSR